MEAVVEEITYTLTFPDLAPDITIWAFLVKAKDGFVCQSCGTSEDLESHHIDQSPEKQFLVSNGKTLCVQCYRIEQRKPRPKVTRWLSPKINYVGNKLLVKQELALCSSGDVLGLIGLTPKEAEFFRGKIYTTRDLPVRLNLYKEVDGTYTAHFTRLGRL